MALTLQSEDVNFLFITYRASYLLGTEAPDNPAYIGDSYYHHVYYNSDGTLQDDKSADRAADMYQTALSYLKSYDLKNAAFTIGAMTHYIADVGVFGHTMGSYTDWGAEKHHSDYESAIESLIDRLDLPPGISLNDKSAYQATLDLAKDITFGKGDIKPNIWMDSNYLWTNPQFEASAMASLYESVEAVASAINHLLKEAKATEEPPPPEAPPPEPPPSEPPSPEPPADEMPIPRTPSAPMGVEIIFENRSVILKWHPPEDDGGADITAYYVFRREGIGDFLQIASVNGNVFSWRDYSVQSGKTYQYMVSAQNSIGMGNSSEPISITIEDADQTTAQEQSRVLQIVLISAAIIAGLGGTILLRRRK